MFSVENVKWPLKNRSDNLILAALTILPFLDFSGEELIFSHAGSPTLKDQAVDTLHSVIQKHIHLPPFFIA